LTGSGNGQYPDSDEYKALFDGRFVDYRLRINGLVEKPAELDLVQVRALPITNRSPSTSASRIGPGSPSGAASRYSSREGKR
jgi:hypothetical protein